MRVSKTGAIAVIVWCATLAVGLWFAPVAGDDAYAHSVMAVEQAKCWRHGELWPRFHPDWNGGTGSFLSAVYSPVALSVDAGLALLTGEGTRAVSLSLIAALAAGAFFMGLVRLDEKPPWWLFVFAPYILVNIFSRATVTEMWALAALAGGLVFLLPPGIGRPREGFVALGAVFLAAGAQPVMLIIVAVPALATWMIALAARWSSGWKRSFAWGLAMFAGTAVFWMPPLLLIKNLDRTAVFSGHYGWRGHFVTNVSGNGQLGPVLLAIWLALGIMAVAGGLVLGRHRDTRGRAMLTFIVACLVLASPVSAPLWTLPGLRMAQFPWRFLGPASLAAVYLLGRLPGMWRRALAVVFLVPAALLPVELGAGRPALAPAMSASQLATATSIRYGIAPVLPSTPGEYAPGFHPLRSLDALASQQGLRLRGRTGSCTSRTYHATVSRSGRYLLPVQWWPFWNVRVDGKPAAFVNDRGLVSLYLDAGRYNVSLALKPSGARWIGGAITAAGALLSVLLWWGAKRFDGRY